MSHFSVLVIGDDVENKLYPYHELECTLSQEEIKDDPRASFIMECKKDDIRNYILKNVFYDRDGKRRKIKTLNKDGSIEKKDYFVKYLEYLKTNNYEKLMNDWSGYSQNEDGNWGRYTNEDAKWDWYSVGGRWSGELKLKPISKVPKKYRYLYEFSGTGHLGIQTPPPKQGYVDYAPFILIDWKNSAKPNQRSIKEQEKLWEQYVVPFTSEEFLSLPEEERKKKISKHHAKTYYSPKYYLDRYLTKENFIKLTNMFSTYAVITDDGEWNAPGDMGWFGCSTEGDEEYRNFVENYYSTFLEPLEKTPEIMMSIIDCHI